MSAQRTAVWISTVTALATLAGCGSSSSSAHRTTTGQPAVTASPTPTAPQTSLAGVVADVQTLHTAAWPAPDQLPLNDTYQWSYPNALHAAITTPDKNGGLWPSMCQNGPTVSATGWKGSQQAQYVPTKNFQPSGHEPGFTAPWSAIGTMMVFADAKSASAALAAIEQAIDTCPPQAASANEPVHFSGVKKVASTPTGQSWWHPAPAGNTRFDGHVYAVQRGPYIMLLQVDKDTQGFSQAPSYTGGSDGGADTAVLNDIADHLCAYAGACE
jgi:hypothetical protein